MVPEGALAALALASIGAIGILLSDRQSSRVFRVWALSRRGQALAGGTHYRDDLQGLRALAVGLVISDHYFGYPGGGFVGVDMFFVLSGFLITGLLLREFNRTGKVSIRGFYVRRIRRIMPAALVTLLVTVAAFYVFVGGFRASQTLKDALFSLIFATNFRLGLQGTNYFNASLPPSPLQHFWSLAVEEQFYLAWPAILISLLFFSHHSRRSLTTWLAPAAGMLLIASLAWSVWQTSGNPQFAYFSTFTRAWELASGALLSIVLFNRTPRISNSGVTLSWLGMFALLASAVWITPEQPFPGLVAVLPVAATVLIIFTGALGSLSSISSVLCFRPLVAMGNISYSLYLWHWPVIVLLRTLAPDHPNTVPLFALVLTFVLAAATYLCVEKPVLDSGWLLPKQRSDVIRHQRDVSMAMPRKRSWQATSLVAILVVSLVGATWLRQPGTAAPSASNLRLSSSNLTDSQGQGPAASASMSDIQRGVQRAAAATEWPSFSPPLEDVLGSPNTSPEVTSCLNGYPIDVTKCTWGAATATKTAVLIGDSTSGAYTAAYQDMANELGGKWKFITRSMNGCYFLDIDVPRDAGSDARCAERKSSTSSLIQEIQPDLVIATHLYSPPKNEQGERMSADEYAAHLIAYLLPLMPSIKHLAMVAPPPQGLDLKECYTRVSLPIDCVQSVQQPWYDFAKAEQVIADKLGATWVDSKDWFCTSEGYCPAFVDQTVIRSDDTHVTVAYDLILSPYLRSALAPVLDGAL